MERLSHSDYARLLDFIAVLQEPVALRDFGLMIVRLTSDLLPGATIAFNQIDERCGEYRGFDHNVPLDLAELGPRRIDILPTPGAAEQQPAAAWDIRG